jgi:ribonuclease J
VQETCEAGGEKAVVKARTSLTFYGGVNEVGGNKILLKDRDTTIFFDFGMSFALKTQYYSSPFLSPKSEESLLEFGLLPKIKGAYRFDKKTEAEVDAIFLSHAHMDHVAYISFFKREIPVYCGETTRTMLETFSKIRPKTLEFDFEGTHFRSFRTGNKITINNIEVEPVHVDHSVPGAYGFLIYTSAGTVIYTGDFRMHGSKPEMTREFIVKAEEAEPIAMISEGTNMIGATISSERDVMKKVLCLIEDTDGLVLADFARTDIDRFNTFYKASRETGRCLAISMRQAYLLHNLRNDKGLKVPSLKDEVLLIFRKEKKRTYKWEREIIEDFGDKVLDAKALSEKQCNFVLLTSFYDLEELVEIKPAPGSCYILSASEPFNEEMEIDHRKLWNWLKHYGLPQYHVHVSGHIMPLQLKNLLKRVNAKKVFPVHVEHADLFARFMRDLKGKVVCIKKGREYRI